MELIKRGKVGGIPLSECCFLLLYTYMDTNLYNDKYKLLIRNLLTHSQFAGNPVKFDGKAQGQQFLHYTQEQCKNILEQLQDKDKVLRIVKYRDPKNTNLLDDGNYYFLEVSPDFSSFADKVLGEDKNSFLASTPNISTNQKPRYIKKKNTLLLSEYEITINAKTIEGIIVDKLLNGQNKRVEILSIERAYKDLTKRDDSYTLTNEDLERRVKAINQKVRRKLQTKLGLISVKDRYVSLNKNLITLSTS